MNIQQKQLNSGPDEATPRKSLEPILVIGSLGLAAGVLSALPIPAWTPEWVNFFGALFVALGGSFATLNHLKVAPDETSPLSWALIVCGGFMIVGAAFRAAMG